MSGRNDKSREWTSIVDMVELANVGHLVIQQEVK